MPDQSAERHPLHALAQAAEMYMLRTEANSAVLVELRHKLKEAITDAKMTLRPGASALADEQAPVPPPVDALLKLVDKFGDARHDVGLWGNVNDGSGHDEYVEAEATAVAAAAQVNADVNALWAAGVAEGRRQATEEARTAAQISTFLDTEEGQLHLRKLIRTGQIVLPHG